MSLTINNVILHHISKNEQEELVINYRGDTLEDSIQAEALTCSLHKGYLNKSNKGFASFSEGSEFKCWLSQMRSNEIGFYQFSQQCGKHLVEHLCRYPFADTGILAIAEYQSIATDYLLIGIIPIKDSLMVDGWFDIGTAEHLDIDSITIAACIDLSSFEHNKQSNRYLTFLKGRSGRKIGDFFLDFLSVETSFDTKQQNQVLIQAVNDFCSDSQLEKEDALTVKKQVADYCNNNIKTVDEIVIKELSHELSTNEDGVTFDRYVSEQGYELEQSFPGDKAVINKLTKFKGSGGGINLTFDAALLSERVFYDPETDSITIKGIPPNLRDQLTRQ